MTATKARISLDRLALGLAALAIQLPLFDRWISFFDEGFIAQVADELNRGLVLYRDTAHLAFPGIFYLIALVFRLTGPSLLVGRLVMVLLFVGMTLLVHALTFVVAGRRAAFAAGLAFVLFRPWAFPHWQMLSYSPPAIVAVSAALLVLLGAMPEGRRRRLVLAGTLFGLGILFKQDYGGYTLAGAHLAIGLGALPPVRWGWRRSGVDLVALDAGAALVLAPVVGAFAAAGALPDFVQQTIVGPLFVHPFWTPGSAAYPGFFGVWPLFTQNPLLHGPQVFSYLPSLLLELHWRDIASHPVFRDTIVVDSALKVVYLLPYALVGGSALGLVLRARRGLGSDDAVAAWMRELVLVTVSAALLASFNKPRDWAHLMILYHPTFVLGALAAARLARRGRGWRRAVVATGAALGAGFAASSIWLVAGAVGRYDTRLALPRAPLAVRADEAALLVDLTAFLARERPPGAPLVALPYYPLINFLAGRPGVGRFRTIVPVEPYPDRDQQVIAALEARPDAVVLYAYTQVMSLPRLPEFAPALHDYLLAHYRLERTFSAAPHGYLFGLLVRDGAVGTARDLLAELPEARLEERRGGETRVLEGAARAERAATVRWSYLAPVLALRPVAGGETVARFALAAPHRGRLVLRAGENPDLWNGYAPLPVRFTVRVLGLGGRQVERTFRLDPQRELADRRWVPVDIDLTPFAGEPIAVELAVRAEDPFAQRPDLAGFEAPRIVE